MEDIYYHTNSVDSNKNMKFCTSILQYLQIESENYTNKQKSVNETSDMKLASDGGDDIVDKTNDVDNYTVSGQSEVCTSDEVSHYNSAHNRTDLSRPKLRHTSLYKTIVEGEELESCEDMLNDNVTDAIEQNVFSAELDHEKEVTELNNCNNTCDGVKARNINEETDSEIDKCTRGNVNGKVGDNINKADFEHRKCTTCNSCIKGRHCNNSDIGPGTDIDIKNKTKAVDDSADIGDEMKQKSHDKRKKWIREKSQSSRELSQSISRESIPAMSSKIHIDNVSQVVEARPRSHHFLWTIPDPGSQKLNWHKPPLTVLVVKKIYDETVLEPFKELISWLVEVRKMIVFVESNVFEDDLLGEDSIFQKYRGRLQTFKDVKDDLTDKIDFIICLGGDGTLLHASSLFQQSCPPVMAFHQGSLGFLTPFNFDNFQSLVTNVLEGHASLLLRYRLKCVICKEDSELGRVSRIKNIDRSSPCANSQILVLNEVVVDRGSSSYICNIDLYVEGRHVTSVQGDGLIISTPTGSTAYAVAAGASMIHPNVPAIMITPICPHSLSFRPIVVPAGVELKIMLSPEARGGAMVSFDGRNRQEIFQGDSVRITTAQFPLPAVCAKDQIDDWFDRLAECLHWNVRKPQKMLSVSSNNSEVSTNSLTNSQNNSTDSMEEGGS